jgi:hypothetical protein
MVITDGALDGQSIGMLLEKRFLLASALPLRWRGWNFIEDALGGLL